MTLVATLAVSSVTATAFAAVNNHRGNGAEESSQTWERDGKGKLERYADFDNSALSDRAKGTEIASEKQSDENENNTNGTRVKNGAQAQNNTAQPYYESASEKVTKTNNGTESTSEEVTNKTNETKSSSSDDNNSSNTSISGTQAAYSGKTLIDIANPDASYNPEYVSLSDYDRAKLERLVMGEAGSMGFEGCALVAQAIRDAMNYSNTSSIDDIINNFGYYGSTSIEPNEYVKAAVSYIFDENGSAVQHRVLCFYIGSSAWHETQNFVTELDGVRFFDMYV